MKKILYSLVILALAVACGQDQTVIKGTVASDFPADALIYLVDGQTVIDSVAVVDGKFEFKVPANPEKYYTVCADYRNRSPRDRSWISGLIPEKGTIKLTLAPAPEDSAIEGSKLNKAYNEFNEKLLAFSKEYREKAATLADDAEEEAEELYDNLMEKVKGISLEAIRKNANNYIAKTALQNIIYDLPLDELKSVLAKCGKFVSEDEGISRILTCKEAELKTAEGQPFVDFAGKTPEGVDIKLSDYVGKGKWVLTDFWASWCGPCMGEIPNIKKVFEDFEGEDFMVLGVAVWDGDNTKSAERMAERDMRWHQIFVGEDHTPTDSYGIVGIPTMILFAPDGTIYKRDGLRGKEMYPAVAAALGK